MSESSSLLEFSFLILPFNPLYWKQENIGPLVFATSFKCVHTYTELSNSEIQTIATPKSGNGAIGRLYVHSTTPSHSREDQQAGFKHVPSRLESKPATFIDMKLHFSTSVTLYEVTFSQAVCP